jgi:succinate dehydrogenase/fumarate reductase flavoprotein subunit
MRTRDVPRLYVEAKDTNYNTEWVRTIQIDTMLQILEMVARASLLRKESRGAMYRKDYPHTDNKNWLKNIVIRQEAGKMKLRTRPVVITKVKAPKRTKVPYWVPG